MRSAREIARLIYARAIGAGLSGPGPQAAGEPVSHRQRLKRAAKRLLGVGTPAVNSPKIFAPPGHFYSPIVDTAALKDTFPKKRPAPPEKLIDVDIDLDAMTKFWDEALVPIIKTAPFSEKPDGIHRYHYMNPAYSFGDGTMLRAMILHNRPRRIVEVGSGWSSACILDTVFDEAKIATEITFVEPYPALLKSKLRGEDQRRVTILEKGVQDVPLSVFECLEANDILFIDGTHVVKTRSDVVHELTEVLPRLKPGVVIHFHDIFYPFEYAYEWVIEHNRSWNEVYALRNFLAYNERFKIIFFNDMFLQLRRDKLRRDCPAFLKNSGGAIWLKRVG